MITPILAAVNKIVIYTPFEDFLYNSDVGATLAVILCSLLGGMFVGSVVGTMLSGLRRYADSTAAKVFGILSGVATFGLAMWYSFA